ncbi:MAG: 1-acyl-sn-glycerol-3-phosphate acyltransferase [Clostridia bacterium]|nr:1-acyl-sn-glycerol-3-phosphate acyltransferase [Clostridia bacterium]
MDILLWILYAILGILGTFIGLIILLFLVTFVTSFFINTKREYNEDSNFYRFMLWSSTGVAMKIMRIKYDLNGFENIPKGKQMLIVGNHRSNFDPLIGWYVFRHHRPSYISKEENFKIPFYGRIIRRCCFMSIDRENPRNAMKTIERATELLKKDEVSIAVYPEGTRSKDCTLLPFHSGVFKVAQKANVPVVVTTIQGTEQVKNNYPWKSTTVRINVVKVIDADYVKATKTSILSDEVRELMEKDLEEHKL